MHKRDTRGLLFLFWLGFLLLWNLGPLGAGEHSKPSPHPPVESKAKKSQPLPPVVTPAGTVGTVGALRPVAIKFLVLTGDGT